MGLAKMNPQRFSSEYYDRKLDLEYYNFLHYSPHDGRWISRDPIAERDGWNLYGFVNNKPLDRTDKLGLKVEKCRRKPNIPLADIAEKLDKKHEWLKTNKFERGLGNSEGIPGVDSNEADNLFSETYLRDHTGQSEAPGSTCEILKNVDEKCVDSYLIHLNAKVGEWIPFITDCNTFVKYIIRKCTPVCRFEEPSPHAYPVPINMMSGNSGKKRIPGLWVMHHGYIWVEVDSKNNNS